MKRLCNFLDTVGWLCVEYAYLGGGELWFTIRGAGPVYRLGNWCYGKSTDLRIKHGLLVRNPKFPGENQPKWVDA